MTDRDYENLYWEAQSHINELETETAALKRENEVLKKYADHKHDCTSHALKGQQCSCGFDALLADTQEKTS